MSTEGPFDVAVVGGGMVGAAMAGALHGARVALVAPERVGDVLFWGILGVFLGGRLGYVAIYMQQQGTMPADWYEVWKGGMSFHGGLMGVVLAYWFYGRATKTRFRDLADGLAVAAPPGIFCVRIANFINAELPGRPWDGPWAMKFPIYHLDAGPWDGTMDRVARHPSQLYEAFGEGVVMYVLMRWLLVGRRWTGGTVAAMFVVCYGAIRFGLEFFREPDRDIGYEFFGWKDAGGHPLLDLTRGQELCLGMIVAGLIA